MPRRAASALDRGYSAAPCPLREPSDEPAPIARRRQPQPTPQRAALAPGCLWIQPAHQAFSFDAQSTARWCGAIFDPAKLRNLVGSDSAVEAAIGLQDPVLGPLMQALTAEVLRGGTSVRRFSDAMLLALAAPLSRLFGQTHSLPKGGVTDRTVARVSDGVDEHLTEDIPWRGWRSRAA